MYLESFLMIGSPRHNNEKSMGMETYRDWILQFPRRAGSPEPRWGGVTNQAKATRTLNFGHTLAIGLPRHWQRWVWLRRLSPIQTASVKTPPDARDCSYTAAIPLSKLPYPNQTSPYSFSWVISQWLIQSWEPWPWTVMEKCPPPSLEWFT